MPQGSSSTNVYIPAIGGGGGGTVTSLTGRAPIYVDLGDPAIPEVYIEDTPDHIAYYQNDGNLGVDSDFRRDETSHTTYIAAGDSGAGNYAYYYVDSGSIQMAAQAGGNTASVYGDSNSLNLAYSNTSGAPDVFNGIVLASYGLVFQSDNGAAGHVDHAWPKAYGVRNSVIVNSEGTPVLPDTVAQLVFTNTLGDVNGVISMDYGGRQFRDSLSTVVCDYDDGMMNSGLDGGFSVDWYNRSLYDGADITVDWVQHRLYAGGFTRSMDWNSRILFDSSELPCIDYASRYLIDTDGAAVNASWGENLFTIRTGTHLEMQDLTTEPAFTTGVPNTSRYYGTNTRALNTPDSWGIIENGGAVYKFPLYL